MSAMTWEPRYRSWETSWSVERAAENSQKKAPGCQSFCLVVHGQCRRVSATFGVVALSIYSHPPTNRPAMCSHAQASGCGQRKANLFPPEPRLSMHDEARHLETCSTKRRPCVVAVSHSPRQQCGPHEDHMDGHGGDQRRSSEQLAAQDHVAMDGDQPRKVLRTA